MELLSLENTSADSAKLLTEKLALAREVATLKPELEHLRSQLSSNQNILAEKLALQRQLSAVEVELDNEKRAKQRLQEKSSKKSMDRRDAFEEHEAEIEDLRKNLKEEKVLHRETKKDAGRLREELEEERARVAASRSEASSAKADADLVESLRRDLAREKREREEAEKLAGAVEKRADSSHVDELKRNLAKEKKEREKAERAIQKAQTEWDAQKELANDKLNQFRSKLKSTKERLKATEEELEKAHAAAANARAIQDFNGKPVTKNPRKRAADPDAALGTPGDGPQAKRGKRATSLVGEKSSFSMTPFLNRKSGVSITSPIREDPRREESGDEATPVAAAKKKKGAQRSKPLAPAVSAKANSKAAAKSKKPVAVLEQVTEETSAITETRPDKPVPQEAASSEQENGASATATSITKVPLDKPIPKLKPSGGATKRPRKSIHTFASFAVEPEPEKRKKRKLGQGFGSTLFDEADDEDRPAKPIPGRGLFAGRALTAVSKSKGGKALITAPDGFQFSPLKKERRAGSLQPSLVA